MNYLTGWHTTVGRNWQTYLYPFWFVLIFATYRRLSIKGITISNYFFWFHILLTIVPAFFINYPFVKTILLSEPHLRIP